MTEQEILAAARKLKDERFAPRNQMLKERSDERFNKTKVEVPNAYKKQAHQHRTDLINDEGRQVATLVYAKPIPHISPPTPEDQPATTKIEMNLIAGFDELEAHSGPVNRQCTMAQVHANIGWIYFAPKKVPYKGQPTAPKDDADAVAMAEYAIKNDRFKMDAGWKAVFDYEYANSETIFYEGNIFDPHCVYVWKEVPASSLKKQYGLQKSRDGSFEKIGPGTPAGYGEGTSTSETMIQVVEYWDRKECKIVAEESRSSWMGMREVKGAFELTSWTHSFGRVPFFARPAYVTEQLDEDKKFSGPLDGIYTEMPEHKRLRTMGSVIAAQTAFSPLQVLTSDQGETIMDDNGLPLAFLELEPGKARQMAPGQRIETIPQSPEVRNFFAEMAASEQRMQRFSLPAVVKGESPGADTANAALSSLHQFNLNMLDPMVDHASLQWQAIFRFALESIRKMAETVPVFDRATDTYLSMGAEDIISINVQAKIVPDQGQRQLLIEKHASELYLGKVITLERMYEMWGLENPEEHVLALRASQLFEGLWPVIQQQIISDMGMLDALKQMMQAQAETGDARNAVPLIMQQARAANDPTGMGSGRPGQERAIGRGIPSVAVNTQEAQSAY